MKALQKAKDLYRNDVKPMTLGDLITATYNACGDQQAPKILQLAMDLHLVRGKRPPA